jgi:protein-S-isoprenylcysteine O-methyltransferase Ste14
MSKYMIAFLVLITAWGCAWIVFHMTSLLIHIILVAAVVSLILHFVRGRHEEADLRINS